MRVIKLLPAVVIFLSGAALAQSAEIKATDFGYRLPAIKALDLWCGGTHMAT